MVRAVDDFLIDSVFQRIADFVHEWTGWDSIFQSRVMVGFQGMLWAAIAGLHLAEREPATPDFFLALLVLTLAAFPGRGAEAARRASRNGMRNPLRLKRFECAVRMVLVTIAPFVLVERILWADQGLFLAVLLSSYLECCDVRQPRKGRLRQWSRWLTADLIQPAESLLKNAWRIPQLDPPLSQVEEGAAATSRAVRSQWAQFAAASYVLCKN